MRDSPKDCSVPANVSMLKHWSICKAADESFRVCPHAHAWRFGVRTASVGGAHSVENLRVARV